MAKRRNRPWRTYASQQAQQAQQTEPEQVEPESSESSESKSALESGETMSLIPINRGDEPNDYIVFDTKTKQLFNHDGYTDIGRGFFIEYPNYPSGGGVSEFRRIAKSVQAGLAGVQTKARVDSKGRPIIVAIVGSREYPIGPVLETLIFHGEEQARVRLAQDLNG